MKQLKLTSIVFGLLLFGCNQPNSNNTPATDKKQTDTASGQTLKQEKAGGSEPLSDDQADSIRRVIALFKTGDIDKISEKIRFPLPRAYPLPSIKDKEEFRQRFSEVFDTVLIDKIVHSEIEQWSAVGWRGIMLDDGVLWMANADGVITAVNYQSDFEKKLQQDLIAKDNQNL